MASKAHLALSSFIKRVHKDLRTSSEILGVQKAWAEHCKNEITLKEYAKCMEQLATEHWDQKHQGDIKRSRNAWIVHQINNYFTNDIYITRRQKELREKEYKQIKCDVKFGEFPKPYNLLDVGSCYSPFKNVENFSTTAIDISPANVDVFKCDFLNLTVNRLCTDEKRSTNQLDTEADTEPSLKRFKKSESNVIESMSEESFDVVVFSLFLGYIPCRKLRFQCCVKAYQLLKYEGILVVVTPDSKHQTSPNVQVIKQWKVILETIGFKRVKYEKLAHLHCMVFRKSCFVKEFAAISALEGEIFVPQDVKNASSDEDEI